MNVLSQEKSLEVQILLGIVILSFDEPDAW